MSGRVSIRARNATILREDFTNTRAFSWLKAPSGALTLLRHYAKMAPKSENGTKIINDDGRLQESMPTYLALLS